MNDLWGFKDIRELEKNTQDMPDSILKEQIALLGDKTGFVLYGKPVFMKVNHIDIDYSMATLFNVVVPKLDNYQKTIMIMYSNPECEYPIAISVGKSIEEDYECFMPQYMCDNKETFQSAIQEILSSEATLRTIGVLYAKAAMLGA